ncbi:MAG TPA: 1-acyl-sn-glycerol-3-phosphate acyltransferase [Pyrinomonadaceae bacterium]|nr:1-acyl-sn-glycerol-3-phosphate acyltransferase [Pyrinomonadaceae bacterium]
MPEDVRVLRLGEMLLRQKGSPARRLIHAIMCIALRLFFRRIEMSEAGRAPASGACVFVLNHPNGLIDPALVFCALPRRISFLAKSTLFRLPVIGYVLRTVEALPLFRRVDAGEDPRQNVGTFEACQELLRQGRCIALFPEGLSHNETQLLPIKSGAARIALGAISVGTDNHNGAGVSALKIAPVGLYYTSKTSFRSEALLRFGEPLEVTPVELDERGEPPREAVRELSARIERALREVTINVETDEELEVALKAGQLFASLEEGLDIEQSLTARFAFLSRFTRAAPQTAGATPEQAAALRRRILAYEEELRGLGLASENLSLSRHSKWYVLRHFLLRGALLLLLLPLSLVGAVLHLPAYLLSTLLARLFTKHGVDEATSTVKILAAVALMPLTWLVLAGLCYYFWGWRAAVASVPLSVLCGYVAMRSLEELYDLRGWLKAVVVLVQRRGQFLRLLLERRSLHRELARAGDETPDA